MILKLAQTSILQSRLSVPYGANLFVFIICCMLWMDVCFFVLDVVCEHLSKRMAGKHISEMTLCCVGGM